MSNCNDLCGSYCQNGVCHGCNKPCPCSTNSDCASSSGEFQCVNGMCASSPGPKPSQLGCPNSYCQNGVCHGSNKPCPCSANSDCASSSGEFQCVNGMCASSSSPKPPPHYECDDTTPCKPGYTCQNHKCIANKPPPPHSGPVKCSSDSQCDQNTWQYCRKGICASKPIPDQAGPHIAAPTIRPSLDELETLARRLHGGSKAPPLAPTYGTPPAKPGRPFRMTLWHEGVKGSPITDPDALIKYMQYYTDFVHEKMFDRTFLQGGDPAMVNNYGEQNFPYADIDFVIDHYLAKLPSYTTAGLLAIIDPRYIGYYDYKIAGGIWGNNPDYADVPEGPYYCQDPYRECAGGDVKYCANTVPIPGKATCDPKNCPPEKPYCDASGCGKYAACTEIKDYCSGSTCCAQYPPGCPNTLEQFFKYVGDLNTKAKAKGVKVVTTIALDGEDFGAYGTDQYGLTQAWQAAKKYAPDVNEIGYAHGPHTRPTENWTNASYPELYWIGELKSAINCIGCPEGTDKSDPTCMTCLNAIYQKNRNNPQGMLAAFDKYIAPVNTQNSPLNIPGTCPLFSIEMSHYGSDSCIKNQFDQNNFCGTFDGFGNWEWDKFEEFMNLFAKKYGVKDIGVYEWQFVPPSWITTTANNENVFQTTVKSPKFWIFSLLAVVCVLVFLFVFWKRKLDYSHG